MQKYFAVVASLTALALTACGGAGAKLSGKQGSADALYALSKPTNQAASRGASPADLSDLTYDCSSGGTAKMSHFAASVDTTDGVSVTQTFTMTLTNCGLASTEAGAALFDGTVEVSQKVVTNANGQRIEQSMKGRVTLGGAVSDFLESDISQSLDVGASQSSGMVSQTLKGTLITSSGTYSFNEAVSVNGSSVSVNSSN